ncbi:hypothetical protein B0H13DRAFT_1960051 [Mycena leptocephala]|nr:hypothetical protein B0H13DRAFT_1960051 [Mycena leptocephala]
MFITHIHEENTRQFRRAINKRVTCQLPAAHEHLRLMDFKRQVMPPVPAPGLRPLDEDDIDWEITRTEAPGIHNLRHDNSPTSPARSRPVPLPSLLTTSAPTTTPVPPSAQTTHEIIDNLLAPTVDVQSADSSMAVLPRLRKRTKRNVELKCGICDEEVAKAERESAPQCTRAGCKSIWCDGV